MSNSRALLRQQVEQAAQTARQWFEKAAISIDRADFEKRGSLKKAGRGAVYVYFSSGDQAIYVGQTTRSVKARLYDQTSPHAQKEWWQTWTSMKYMPLSDTTPESSRKMDRLLLEFLLILAYEPSENRSPSAIRFEKLFAE